MDTTIADLTNSALQTPAELEKSRLIGYPSWMRNLQTNSTNGLAECLGRFGVKVRRFGTRASFRQTNELAGEFKL